LALEEMLLLMDQTQYLVQLLQLEEALVEALEAPPMLQGKVVDLVVEGMVVIGEELPGLELLVKDMLVVLVVMDFLYIHLVEVEVGLVE